MMNLPYSRIIYLLIATIFVISACKKEESDVEKPKIINFKIGENNEAVLYAGQVIYLEFEASDNVELANYKVSISKASKGNPSGPDGWEFSKTYSIVSGKKTFKVISQLITVPEDALTANYSFKVTLYDRAGNFESYSTIVPLLSE
jgi:hypothetical protein